MKPGFRLAVLWGLASALPTLAATVEGNVDPQKLLDWFNQQIAIPANVAVQANGLDMNHGGTGFCLECSDENSNPTPAAKTVSLYQTTAADFFEADMDIDCDGSGNGVCGGTDPSHQNLLSCDDNAKCSKDNGGPIDAAGSAFYVIPLGSPFNYSSRGIGIGQLAAIINLKTNPISLIYAPFLDEDGVSQEIGEASAYAAQLLSVPDDPNTGGQSSGIVYIIFRGTAARFTSVTDMADHQKAITVGESLAAALIAPTAVRPEAISTASGAFHITPQAVHIIAGGLHSVSIFDLNGKSLLQKMGTGPQTYSLSPLRPGLYFVRISTPMESYTAKIVRY